MNVEKVLESCEFEDLFIYQKEYMKKYQTNSYKSNNENTSEFNKTLFKFVQLLIKKKDFKINNDYFQVAMIEYDWAGAYIRYFSKSDKKKVIYYGASSRDLFHMFLKGYLYLL